MTQSWTIYCDGACAPTNPGPCGWGAVLISNASKEAFESYGFIGHGTNQVAEITAAIESLAQLPAGAKVALISDSQYMLKGLKEWRAGWEKNGFKNSKKQPVANLDLWKRLYAEADKRIVSAVWVRGHSGSKFNEMADALANKSLATRDTLRPLLD